MDLSRHGARRDLRYASVVGVASGAPASTMGRMHSGWLLALGGRGGVWNRSEPHLKPEAKQTVTCRPVSKKNKCLGS